ncbi:MAG: hypothetical protein Q9160_006329 [Pyrenula sp. 1 TL-2023]
MVAKIPLWLDCDPGHDDAFAILLAAHHPSLDLLGITTVHGNASLAQCTSNTLSILETIGRPGACSVYPGAAKPFCRLPRHAPDIHGQSGLDGTDLLPQPSRKSISCCNAILDMREALLACEPNTAWIVATGALTNVALLIATFPEITRHIRGLSIMGGAIGSEFAAVPVGPPFHDDKGNLQARIGNVTPYAEFNIWCDPEAAQSIFSNRELADKITLIPLDVTHQAFATKDVQRLLLHGSSINASPTRLRKMYHDLLMFFASTYSNVFDLREGPPVHDPLAVAVLLRDHKDDNVRISYKEEPLERFMVEVVCEGQEVGRTIVKEARGQKGAVSIPRSLDVAKFWQVLNDCMETADRHLAQMKP